MDPVGEEREYFDFEGFVRSGLGTERTTRRRGGIRYYILWMLSRRKMSSSEITSELQKQTSGWWMPGHGSVHSLISRLESERLIFMEKDGRYSITDLGKQSIGIGRGRKTGLKGSDIDRILIEMEKSADFLKKADFDRDEYRYRISRIAEKLYEIAENEESGEIGVNH